MSTNREPYRKPTMARKHGSQRSSDQKTDSAETDARLKRSWITLAPIWIVSDGQHSTEENIDENSDILIEDGYDWLR